MTIGLDIRVLSRGVRTGVEEYTINLLNHLLPLEPKISFKLFYNAYRKASLDYPWLNLKNVQLKDFKIPNRFFFVGARYLQRPKIDRLLKGIDLYFNPHFFAAPLSADCRKIVTFHDLSFERYPQFFSWRKRGWQRFLMDAQQEAVQADKIIAVSQSTKNDLIDLYGIKPGKIRVIYSGIGEQFRPIGKRSNMRSEAPKLRSLAPKLTVVRKKYNLPDRFILYFGTIEPRKNIIGLIKAFELLKRKRPVNLVIAGAKGWLDKDIFKTANQSKQARDIFFTGFIEEVDKPYLYNLAELFVYPSFFEGFGFPPLEAMACGVPTIVSNVSSLPEVVGRGALMIDPYHIDELAWAMETVLTDNMLKEKLIEKGISQAKKFSWQKCARQTLKVLTRSYEDRS